MEFSPIQEASVRLRAAAPPEPEIPLRMKSDRASDNPFVRKDDFEERRERAIASRKIHFLPTDVEFSD